MSKRKIVVAANTYTWHTGRSFIEIRRVLHDGSSRTIIRESFEQFTGMTPDEVERAVHKGYFMITPAMVESRINKFWEDERIA